MVYVEIDAARILLPAVKIGVPVRSHAGGVGLCELVQHLAMFGRVAVSGSAQVHEMPTDGRAIRVCTREPHEKPLPRTGFPDGEGCCHAPRREKPCAGRPAQRYGNRHGERRCWPWQSPSP